MTKPNDPGLPEATSFGSAISKELDAIGFVGLPDRAERFAADLGVVKAQAYRILNGSSLPTPKALAVLRRYGCSIDRIIDAATGAHRSHQTLKINGRSVTVNFRVTAQADSNAHLVAVPDGSAFTLEVLNKQGALPKGAISLSGIDLVSLPRVAMLDDDEVLLELLQRQLSSTFDVATFTNSEQLTTALRDGEHFVAIVADWLLPGMAGTDVITGIRALTEAPIFILTGNTSASDQLVRAMDIPRVTHISKPCDSRILAKRIQQETEHA